MSELFDHLYDHYHQDVFQFLMYMVRNREQAEDLVQEVYIRVLKAHEHFEGKSHEKTWLLSIARNVAIDHFRKHKNWKKRLMNMFDWKENQLIDSAALPEEIAMQNEEVATIYHSLGKCTVDQRSVVILRYIHELTITETASILNWTESKVKTTQHRAVKALRQHMSYSKEEGGERLENKRAK
ncbi:RNA polymerase sigma factor SigX [Priestia koreensis]|uniref:RNA polymerase sigma factor SigX n=1 Tax=Priestia koreensis TaxID=284581 RepID=UPI001F5A1F43|nr:RNA polymerase sigma factor SigX [Priestia koreensis]UNL84053.1 RNA polymerase sigma factor SigX [Priestia koreensis]